MFNVSVLKSTAATCFRAAATLLFRAQECARHTSFAGEGARATQSLPHSSLITQCRHRR